MIGTDVHARLRVYALCKFNSWDAYILRPATLGNDANSDGEYYAFFYVLLRSHFYDAHEKFFLPNTIIKSALSFRRNFIRYIKLLVPVVASCNLRSLDIEPCYLRLI